MPVVVLATTDINVSDVRLVTGSSVADFVVALASGPTDDADVSVLVELPEVVSVSAKYNHHAINFANGTSKSNIFQIGGLLLLMLELLPVNCKADIYLKLETLNTDIVEHKLLEISTK